MTYEEIKLKWRALSTDQQDAIEKFFQVAGGRLSGRFITMYLATRSLRSLRDDHAVTFLNVWRSAMVISFITRMVVETIESEERSRKALHDAHDKMKAALKPPPLKPRRPRPDPTGKS